MKIFYLLLYFTLAPLFFSCSDNNDETGEGGALSAGRIMFNVGISDFTAATRVSQDGSSWNSGDRIGAFALDVSTSNPLDGLSNALYACLESGESVNFVSDAPLTMKEGSKTVKFMAYYPYDAEIQDTRYPVNLADQAAGSSACDLMYAVSEPYTYLSEDQTPVGLTFSHCLSKVFLKVVSKNGKPLAASDVAITDVVIKGMSREGTFDLQLGKITSTVSTGNITTHRNVATGAYEAVVLPVVMTDKYGVSFTVNGEEYNWAFVKSENMVPERFKKGYQYTFVLSVDVNTGEIEGNLENISNGNSSAPWGDGEGTSGLATVKQELFPAHNAMNVFADTELRLTFKGEAPVRGDRGCIRIFDAATDEQVDVIDMSEKHDPFSTNKNQDARPRYLNTWMNIIGEKSNKNGALNRKLVINYYPIEIIGNTLIITPHSHRLESGKKYYVTLDRNVISHKDFYGIRKNEWVFTTKKVLQGKAEVIVSHTNPDADFYTLQGAIDYLATNVGNDIQKAISMESGIYKEIINLRDQDNITIKSVSGHADDVNIQYCNYNNLNGSTMDGKDIAFDAPLHTTEVTDACNRSVVVIAGTADKIRFENITIQNSYAWIAEGDYQNGQAEAILLRTKGAVAIVNCKLLGYQDTVYAGASYAWFYNCYIAGRTDYIWACGEVALFEKCELHAVEDTRAVMWTRGKPENLGYVFSQCNFTAADGVDDAKVIYEPDNITFLNCTFAEVYAAKFIGTAYDTDGNRFLEPTEEKGCRMYACKIASSEQELYAGIKDEGDKGKIHQLGSLPDWCSNTQAVMRKAGYNSSDWFKQ